MKAIVMMLLLFKALTRVTAESGFEFNKALNDAKRFVEDNASRSSANDDIDHTIQLQSRQSNISWEFLVNSFNLTTEDLELSYETIWNEGRRTITLKRARGQAEDKKGLPTGTYQLNRERRNRIATRQDRDTNERVRVKRKIIGADGRKQLPSSRAQKSPHSAACKVSCKGFCSWSCSGILIGPLHVLTSAHCIDGVEVATLQAGFLERNGRLQWYNVAKAYIPLRWKVDSDYAVLKLKGLPSRRSHVSVAPMALPKNSKISITGFPGDKDPESLWISKCRALLVTSGLIWNDCDVKRGSSGSGVLAKDNSSGSPRTVVVGVLSGDRSLVLVKNGRTRKVRLNVAVHLTGPKLSQINEWTNG